VRVSGQLRQLDRDDVVDVAVVRVGEQRLAHRGRMQREQCADFEHLQARVGTKDVMDDEDAVAVRDADADGLADARRQELGPGERAGA
jgi:hypothetical protein